MRAEIVFEPLAPAHFDALELAPAHAAVHRRVWRPAFAQQLCVPGLAFAGLHDGRLFGCAGIVPETPWCGAAWVLIGACVPRRAWPAVTRQARAVLDEAQRRGLHRISAHVDPDVPAACRWIRRLGFEADGLARAWFHDGRDAVIVSRVS